MTAAPTITVALTLHPDARDGQQNAWKVEMFDANRGPLMVETGSTAAACLDRASAYLASGWVERTLTVPFDVPTMFHQVRGFDEPTA